MMDVVAPVVEVVWLVMPVRMQSCVVRCSKASSVENDHFHVATGYRNLLCWPHLFYFRS